MKQNWFAVLIFFAAFQVNASLVDRGNGLIYDSTLNITWLSNANYASIDLNRQSRIDSLIGTVVNGRTVTGGDFAGYDEGVFTGRMLWWGATAWAESLTYSGTNGWRLPTTIQPDFSCDLQFVASTTGGFPGVPSSGGHNCASSELGFMFYENLGASAYSSAQSGTQVENLALFANLTQFLVGDNPNAHVYWTSTLDASYHGDPSSTSAWYFDYGDGWQGFGNGLSFMNAWVVHDGDVGRSIPEPNTITLTALAISIFLARRSRNRRYHFHGL